MSFDFSTINRSTNVDRANRSLEKAITDSVWSFYRTYSAYLGGDENELLKNIDDEEPARTLKRCVKLVQNVISKAWESGEEPLASVQGVRIGCPQFNSP